MTGTRVRRSVHPRAPTSTHVHPRAPTWPTRDGERVNELGDVVATTVDRLTEPLARLLGTRTAGALAKLGLHTTGDLLRHYPRRYSEPGTLTDLSSLDVGEHVTVMAEVRQATVRPMRSRGGAMLQAVVTDGTHRLHLTFFAKGAGALRRARAQAAGRDGSGSSPGSSASTAATASSPTPTTGSSAWTSRTRTRRSRRRAGRSPSTRRGAAVPSWRIGTSVRTVLDPLTRGRRPRPAARAGPPRARAARGCTRRCG